jgi:hypothetical protein
MSETRDPPRNIPRAAGHRSGARHAEIKEKMTAVLAGWTSATDQARSIARRAYGNGGRHFGDYGLVLR